MQGQPWFAAVSMHILLAALASVAVGATVTDVMVVVPQQTAAGLKMTEANAGHLQLRLWGLEVHALQQQSGVLAMFWGVGTMHFDMFNGDWSCIAAVGTTSYAAPLGAPTMLAVDTVSAIPRGIVTEGVDSGGRKWTGIASMGTHISMRRCQVTCRQVTCRQVSYMPPSYMPPS